LYNRVSRTALPIHFFTSHCRSTYRSATTHNEKRNRPNFSAWINHRQRDPVTMAIPDAAFSAVRFCSYILRYNVTTVTCSRGQAVENIDNDEGSDDDNDDDDDQ